MVGGGAGDTPHPSPSSQLSLGRDADVKPAAPSVVSQAVRPSPRGSLPGPVEELWRAGVPVVSPLIPAALTCLGWLSGGEGGSRELEAVPEGFSGQPGSERWGRAVLPSLRPQPRAPGAPAVHAGCPGAHTGLPADSQGCRSRAVWPRAAQGVGVGDTKPPGPGLGGLSGGGGRGLGWHSGGRGRPSGTRGLGLSHAEVCVGRARAAGDTWLQPHCFKLAKPTAPSPRSRIESDSKHRKLSGRKNSPPSCCTRATCPSRPLALLAHGVA